MNATDRYHVYSGFVLGLSVANELMQGMLGDRADEILKQLRAISRNQTKLTPSDTALVKSFPLSQDDERFIEQCHPILAKAAKVVHEFRGDDPGEAGSLVQA